MLLFPLAAGWAISALPAWVLLRTRIGTDAGPIPPTWHGHEMLFGFALTVVAGFLVTRIGRLGAWLLVGAWLAARLAALFGSTWPVLTAVAAGLAFAFALWASAAPPLLRAAKRPENRIVPSVLLLFLLADALWWAGVVRGDVSMQRHALYATVDLLALLTLIVGGRALPAAIGGYLERRGIPRDDRTRFGLTNRRYELPLAFLVGVAGAADAFGAHEAAGLLCLTAALLALMRVAAWPLRATLARPALWTLALGYLWLIPGLALKGGAQAFGWLNVNTSLHGITIGAVGTLTLIMMARTQALRARRSLDRWGDMATGSLLLGLAALLRLAGGPADTKWLWAAAGCWSFAFLLLLVRLVRTARTGALSSPPRRSER